MSGSWSPPTLPVCPLLQTDWGPGRAASQLLAGSCACPAAQGGAQAGQGHLEPERVHPQEAGKEVCGVPSDHGVSKGPPSSLTCCMASSPAETGVLEGRPCRPAVGSCDFMGPTWKGFHFSSFSSPFYLINNQLSGNKRKSSSGLGEANQPPMPGALERKLGPRLRTGGVARGDPFKGTWSE